MFFQLLCACFQTFTKLELADLKLCFVLNYMIVCFCFRKQVQLQIFMDNAFDRIPSTQRALRLIRKFERYVFEKYNVGYEYTERKLK